MGKRISDLGTWSANGLGTGLLTLDLQDKLNVRMNKHNPMLASLDKLSSMNGTLAKFNSAFETLTRNNVLADDYMRSVARGTNAYNEFEGATSALSLLANSSPFNGIDNRKISATDLLAQANSIQIPNQFLNKKIGIALDNIRAIAESDSVFWKTVKPSAYLEYFDALTAPNTAIDAIRKLHSSTDGIMAAFKQMNDSCEGRAIKGLNLDLLEVSLDSFTTTVTKTVIQKKDWSLLEKFAEVSADVAEVVVRKQDATKEKVESARKGLKEFATVFAKKYRSRNKQILMVKRGIALLIAFTTLHMAYDFYFNPSASKEDIEKLLRSLRVEEQNTKQENSVEHSEILKGQDELNANMEEVKQLLQPEFRITVTNCKLTAEAKNRSPLIANIPAGTKLEVMHSYRNWVNVYCDSGSGALPLSGWILAEYLEECPK